MSMRIVLPKTMKILSVFAILMSGALIFTAFAREAAVNSPPTASITLLLNDEADYRIHEIGDLYSEGTDDDGDVLTFTWTVIESPQGDPDHTNEELCQRVEEPGIVSCIIAPFFFEADDVGTWKIRLTVSDGQETAQDEVEIRIAGFVVDERRPTHAEGGSVEPLRTKIKYDDWNYKALLKYSDVDGVTYWLNPNDQDLPNGHRENHYMQPILIPILERISELAKQDRIDLWVTDAWDQDDGHAATSIHYEGRALDLDFPCGGCTTQKDQAGLGRLAYLVEKAVKELGIEHYWIWHEFTHVHLSVNGIQADPAEWGYRCETPFCLNHIEQTSEEKSGAAVGSMLLDWLAIPTTQDEFYQEAGSPANGISCGTMAEILNTYSEVGWQCVEAISREEAMRTVAFWFDYTYQLYHFGLPAAIPTGGDYRHWLGIEGAIASMEPTEETTIDWPGGGNYIVGGLFVDDPSFSLFNNHSERFEAREILEESYLASPSGAFEVLVAAGCEGGGSSLFKSSAAVGVSDPCGNSGGVSIFAPSDLDTFSPGETVTVKVSAPIETDHVILEIGGTESARLEDQSLPWEFSWTPTAANGTYFLDARAILTNGEELVTEETVTVFTNSGEGPSISSPDPVLLNNTVTVTVSAPDATGVSLAVDSVEVQLDTHTGSDWRFLWAVGPPAPRLALLLATAEYADGRHETTTTTVSVLDGSQNLLAVEIESPGEGDEVALRRSAGVRVGSPGPISRVELHVTDPSGSKIVIERTNDDPCEAPCYTSLGVGWTPVVEGEHKLKAFIWNPDGLMGWTDMRTVKVVNRDEIIQINEHAFILKVAGIRRDWVDFDTQISTAEYACGLVGYRIKNGDIAEKGIWSIFFAYVKPQTTWHLIMHFATHVGVGDSGFGDPNEHTATYSADILCIDTEMASANGPDPGKSYFLQKLTHLGDNVDETTTIKVDEFACGIVGFATRHGDINENGTGDIMQMYLYPKSGEWYVRADFRTHKDDNEDWDVYLLCARREVASLDVPLPDKPAFLREFRALGDNVDYDTGISTTDYVCGVVGFAALDGDIDEHNAKGRQLIYAYMHEEGGSWRFRGDFRTHKNGETWDVNVICFQKENGTSPEWNASQSVKGDGLCMVKEGACAILRDEAINLSGDVIVQGGGYSGHPTQRGWQCPTPEHIVVYINDRDPNTGRNRWTPDKCLLSGDTFNLIAEVDYDFRGVSVVGGSPNPIELRDPKGPPVLTAAYPKLFPVPYGPGVSLQWEPTLHPGAVYYEIQFSEDGGATWQVYTRSRDISHGGWMNHHSNLKCGFGFERCLKRRQSYTYRVRVLDSARNPLTAWSNTLSTISFEWPAHVNLASPEPPGPYPPIEEVHLELEGTYGEGLRLEWTITPYSGAEYEVLDGCVNGSLSNPKARFCDLRIRRGDLTLDLESQAKMAALAPETSVDVRVTGTDSFGLSASGKVSLIFTRPCSGKGCDIEDF